MEDPHDHALVTNDSFTNSIGMKFNLVPAGEFLMGEPPRYPTSPLSGPQHKVRITKSFYMGVTEVTVDQYGRLMPHPFGVRVPPNHPVSCIRWDEAVEFCRLLSALPEEVSAGRTFRLPTEAEWEYACRAGSTSRFSFGDDPNDLDDYAWSRRNAGSGTHPVGEKMPNTWGFYDMLGNVMEFCSDRWDRHYYAYSPIDDPTGPETGNIRVIRGGDFFLFPEECCASAARFTLPTHRGFSYVGFRVAADG